MQDCQQQQSKDIKMETKNLCQTLSPVTPGGFRHVLAVDKCPKTGLEPDLRTQGRCSEFAARHYLLSQTFTVTSLRAHQDRLQHDLIETMGQEVFSLIRSLSAGAQTGGLDSPSFKQNGNVPPPEVRRLKAFGH